MLLVRGEGQFTGKPGRERELWKYTCEVHQAPVPEAEGLDMQYKSSS